MLTGLYWPGDSVLHRAPAGLKLALLAVLLIPVSGWPTWPLVAGAAALVACGYVAAGVGLRRIAVELWPLRWFVVVLVPYQLWAVGLSRALLVVLSLLAAVAAASLVTLTTRLSALMAVVVALARPLRVIGVDPARVALVVSLAIRAIPVITSFVEQVRAARRARGIERDVRTLLTPVVVRSVRYADRVGDALAARGLDD